MKPAAIEEYAVIGDGRTVALITREGRVDWWPVPTLDSPPVLSGLVEPERGGHLSLRPKSEFTASHRYVPGTNVLETTFETKTGTAKVTDSLNTGTSGRLAWTELARRVEAVDGEITFVFELVPGDRFASASAYTRMAGDVARVDLADQHLAVLSHGAGQLEVEAHTVRGSFTASSEKPALLTVVATDDEPLYLPGREEIEARIGGTVSSWRGFSDQVQYEGRWSEQVLRSALALKALTYSPSGAIAAAATTSLPEALGGSKNWDYRYTWIRDTGFALEALIALGLHEEVQATVSFLLSSIKSTAPKLQVFYRLDGTVADETNKLDADGYRESTPVRSGNSAAGQRQLGTFGDVFAVMARYVAAGHVLDHNTGKLLEAIADECCDEWRQPDAGLWELGQYEQYTISKMQCWAALGHAVELARGGHIPATHADRWRLEQEEIHSFVEERCWSEVKESYTFYAGTDELDASVLLAGRLGFDAGTRLRSTIDAVRAELGEKALVYRYSGMQSEEGAFIACSFWLVDALWRVGRRQEAVELMDELVEITNEAGLLSEQIDPATGHFLGNIPQGLSHLALINSAVLLSD